MKKTYQSPFSPRQYMLSKDFEIFYYDDTRFSGVRSHSHNYYEFYFFLHGDISMKIASRIYPLKAGDVILIPPGIPHNLITHDPSIPYRRFVFWISEEYFENLSSTSLDYAYVISQAVEQQCYIYHNDVVHFNHLQGRLMNLLEELHSDHFGKETALKVRVNELILFLNRLAYEANHPPKAKEKRSLYENLMFYIEHHLEDELSLEDLAKEFFVSKYHIAHIFKENMGLSIHQYITKKRLSMCRNALLNDVNITETIHSYGFKDYSSFFRAFKKEYGISPKEYRESKDLKTLVD